MKRLSIKTFLVFAAVIATIPWLLSGPLLIATIPWLYLAALLSVNVMLYQSSDNMRAYFSPSSLMCNYVGVTFVLGAFGFSQQYIFRSYSANYSLYYDFQHLQAATSFFLLCIFATQLAYQMVGNRQLQLNLSSDNKTEKTAYILLALLCLPVFSVVSFSIPFFGPSSFSILPAILASLVLVYYARRSPSKKRFILYLLLLLYFVIVDLINKRTAMFFLLTVVFLEAVNYRQIVLNKRVVFLTSSLIVLGVLAIVTMSILRGFGIALGVARVDNIFVAISLVPAYFRSTSAMTLLLHNLEATASYFHSVYAVEAVATTGEYTYGSTFATVLFVPIPRALFAAKPDSILDLYNTLLYPLRRLAGLSFVPNLYADAFWNFGMLGTVFIYGFFYALNVLYNTLVYYLREQPSILLVYGLGVYFFLVTLFRGAGMDNFGAYLILFWIFTTIFFFISRMLARAATHQSEIPRWSETHPLQSEP